MVVSKIDAKNVEDQQSASMFGSEGIAWNAVVSEYACTVCGAGIVAIAVDRKCVPMVVDGHAKSALVQGYAVTAGNATNVKTAEAQSPDLCSRTAAKSL